MKAPYLKVENKDIEIGQEYYVVQHFAPHTVTKRTAGNENNTANLHYRFLEKDALELSQLLTIHGKIKSAYEMSKRMVSEKCFDGTFVIRIGSTS